MGPNLSNNSFATVIIADQSPVVRRTCCKMVKAAVAGKTEVREASTLHAVRVLLRDLRPDLIIASDELAGGDSDLLISAIRDCEADRGGDARIILISHRAHAPGAHALGAEWSGAEDGVAIVPWARAAEMLPTLIAPSDRPGGAWRAGEHGNTGQCDNKIVPFRVEERRIIETAIQRAGGDIGKAARALEISPSTIYRKIQVWHA